MQGKGKEQNGENKKFQKNELKEKREEEIANYIEQINKLQEEKKKFETYLEIDEPDIINEGIDLEAINESINELEVKLEEYNQIISKISEINSKIKELENIINLNNKEIEKLEKEISEKENKLSEALKKYNNNKSLSDKELEKQKEIDITKTIMKDKQLNSKSLNTEVSNLRQSFKNHQDKIKAFFDNKNNIIYREINNAAQVVTPAYLFENIQKKCKDFFLKEFNEFLNIYSKIYDINYKFTNLFICSITIFLIFFWNYFPFIIFIAIIIIYFKSKYIYIIPIEYFAFNKLIHKFKIYINTI